MSRVTDTNYLKTKQYANSSNLGARIALHRDYSTNPLNLQTWLFDRLLATAPENARILEVGCGRGDLWALNRDRVPAGWDVTLIDFSAGMLDDARTHMGEALVSRFTLEVASAQDLPFEDDSFDIVMAHFMLYHVPEPTEAAAELRRVLRPDGTAFAATLGKNHMRQMDAAIYGVYRHDLLLNRATTRPFSLENGADILRTAFGEVTLDHYDCDLAVTAVQPLVDYARSMFPETEFTPEQIATLSETFSQEIAAHGAFHITKDTAMFVARGYTGL